MSATLDDLLNALFKPEDESLRNDTINIMTSPDTSLRVKVETALLHVVKDRLEEGRSPYYTQFVSQFTEQELEDVFGQDTYGKLILVKELFEDRRLRDMSYQLLYMTYFVNLLPVILKKARSTEDILRWDNAVKDIIVAYAESEHPYGYITGSLRQLVFNSHSFEMLEKAKLLIMDAKEEIPSNLLDLFTDLLSIAQGRIKEPKGLEEWYPSLVIVINKYRKNLASGAYLDSLKAFVKEHDSPKSLSFFRPVV